jgi:hypothetical protein
MRASTNRGLRSAGCDVSAPSVDISRAWRPRAWKVRLAGDFWLPPVFIASGAVVGVGQLTATDTRSGLLRSRSLGQSPRRLDFGVGHTFVAILASPELPLANATGPFVPSLARGVGHCLAIVSRPGRSLPVRPAAPPRFVPYAWAVGVGYSPPEDEQPLPLVRCADIGRSEQAPLRIEPELGQRPQNSSETSSRSERWDVLQHDEAGSYFAKHPCDLGPEPPLVVFSELLAGDAPGLTGEAGSDAIHLAAPCRAVEVSKVKPDRRRSQVSRLHLSDQARGGESFPLHVADAHSRTTGRELQAELETAVSGTEPDDAQLGGR